MGGGEGGEVSTQRGDGVEGREGQGGEGMTVIIIYIFWGHRVRAREEKGHPLSSAFRVGGPSLSSHGQVKNVRGGDVLNER